MSAPWEGPPPLPGAVQAGLTDEVRAMLVSASMGGLLQLAAATSSRSVQTAIGPSDAGHPCDRRLVYRMGGTEPVNVTDTWRATVGSGVHLQLAADLGRIAKGSGRMRFDVPVNYRGIKGSADFYDRFGHIVIDFKTTTKARLAKLKREGPPKQYVTQVQIYAAGLKALGETPAMVGLLFLPIDGTSDDFWAWVAPVDTRLADDAVDRVTRLRDQIPLTAQAHPDRLCTYCPYFQPGATALNEACPGPTEHKGES